ncbi:transglycosylase SLT domain-containing protein [Thermodesulfobacteriota bacterium]
MILFSGSSLSLVHDCKASEPFPLYQSIKPNVEFWKKVYTQYSTTEGIIHDARNLNVIYEVIKLKKDARKINRDRIKRVKSKYRLILQKLASNPEDAGPEAARVAALFGSRTNRRAFRRAMDNIRCQIGQKDRFRQGLIRSGAYLGKIKTIIRSNGLPLDLAYLPHVESSFNPKAFSKFGAAGIWQFTRSTGKRYLKVGYVLDERRDPIYATFAAAKLLKENFAKLGNWPMAITAYNHGAAGMLRAKKAKGGYENVFKNYSSRTFKFASRNFYSEFLAARGVAKNHKRYFGELKLAAPRKTQKIELKGYASLKDLVGVLDTDPATIRDLNPALRQPVYRGQKYVPKGYVLRLPHKHDKSGLKLSADLPPNIYKPHQKRSRFYVVQKGDTAGRIAMNHRVKLSDLILANNLNTRATVYPGQNLRLPTPGEKRDRVAGLKVASLQVNQPKKQSKQKPKSKQVSPKKISPTPVEQRRPTTPVNPEIVTSHLLVEKVVYRKGKPVGFIRVEAEETLGHYAEWLGIPTQKIRTLNGFLYGQVIRTEQRIKLPFGQVSKEAFEEKRFEYHKEIEEDFFASYKIDEIQPYRVKNGDNIWKLCYEVFEVPFWLIKKYNSHLNFNQLQPSHELVVPVVSEIDKPGIQQIG